MRLKFCGIASSFLSTSGSALVLIGAALGLTKMVFIDIIINIVNATRIMPSALVIIHKGLFIK